MDKYFLNKNTDNNPNGDHEVHRENCHILPLKDFIELGYHANCHEALTAAKAFYPNVDGCEHCVNPCHKG